MEHERLYAMLHAIYLSGRPSYPNPPCTPPPALFNHVFAPVPPHHRAPSTIPPPPQFSSFLLLGSCEIMPVQVPTQYYLGYVTKQSRTWFWAHYLKFRGLYLNYKYKP